MNRNSITEVGAKLRRCERSEGFWSETKDCTVRALAIAANVEYSVAHAVARAGGRQNGQGYWLHPIIGAAEKWELRFTKVWSWGQKQKNGCDITVKRFVETREPGRYIVEIRGHAVGVVIGEDRTVEVSDAHWGKYSTVLQAWKYEQKI